jgi:hypothetical protein
MPNTAPEAPAVITPGSWAAAARLPAMAAAR